MSRSAFEKCMNRFSNERFGINSLQNLQVIWDSLSFCLILQIKSREKSFIATYSMNRACMLKQQLQRSYNKTVSPPTDTVDQASNFQPSELEERVKHELENPALEEERAMNKAIRMICRTTMPEPMEGGGDESSISDDGNEFRCRCRSFVGDYMTADDIPEYKLREMNDRAEKRKISPSQLVSPWANSPRTTTRRQSIRKTA